MFSMSQSCSNVTFYSLAVKRAGLILLAITLITLCQAARSAEPISSQNRDSIADQSAKAAENAEQKAEQQKAEQRAEQLATQWDNILTNIVRDGLVDYSRAKQSKPFEAFISQLQDFDAATLSSPNARKAHLINMYNAFTVDLVAEHYPVESIKDIGGWFSSPWSIEVTEIGGEDATLDDIEHEMLRKMGDPRIHYAINCASISCPNLRTEAFRANRIDQQLNEQRLEFISSDKGLQFDGQSLEVSKIFRWFDEDWGGASGVLKMLQAQHPKGAEFRSIDAYLHYDWSLNEAE